MKAKFLEDMRFLWPNGVEDRGQHRDIIRVYAMGWGSALMATGDKAAVEKWVEEYAVIAAPGWWPDLSWEWCVPNYGGK